MGLFLVQFYITHNTGVGGFGVGGEVTLGDEFYRIGTKGATVVSSGQSAKLVAGALLLDGLR